MALSRKHVLRDIVVPLVAGLATPLLLLGLLRLFFGPEVQRVDPTVLRELRTVGRVVGEYTETFHQYENFYVDNTYLVVHLGGSAKGDVLDEVGRRLKPKWLGHRRMGAAQARACAAQRDVHPRYGAAA
ncbi:hypothetical protein SAMN05421874_1199 [Nonomuraea maritima]|uniref:Uncharacterized protein n=1 Tax=Nonomuraea maritima TaxID=683260 RepID=A0A1G9IVX6_9ACTN|nr:hypothetical protein [Nonomuraea maritima]SDL29418.1 hypothetical protein SAMN05421874_1199 [Nonomuraea maritima]